MAGRTCHHSLPSWTRMQPARQVPSRASLLTVRPQLLPQWRRARGSPPKGLFGSDRKELEDEIFRLQNMQKESQEVEKPRQEKPQQEAVNLLIPLAVIVWFEMASTLIDKFRPASSL